MKKISLLIILATMASNTYAEDNCGGFTSVGNPLPCCTNGGNCTWWTWRKADLNGWVAIPTGKANTWDDTALGDVKHYTVSTTPSVGSIGVKELSSGTYASYGHVAYIENINKDSSGKIISVGTSEMNCGGGYGVSNPVRAIGYFDKYVTMNNLDGKFPGDVSCKANYTKTVSDSIGNKLTINYSTDCKTNWAVIQAKGTVNSTTATITRSRDGKTVSANNLGSNAVSPMVQTKLTDKACATGKVNGNLAVFPQLCM